MPKPLKFALFAIVLLLLGISAHGTVATWRAESTVVPPSLTTGSLELLAGGEAKYDFTELAGNQLVPGAFTQAPLTISNSGTVDLTYRLDGASDAAASPSAADRALAGAVKLSIYSGMDQQACEADQPLTGEALYSGPLDPAANFAKARVLSAKPAAASETLCVRLSVPEGATQAASGGQIKLSLRFTGQQQ